MELLIGKFLLANKEFGLSHLVRMNEEDRTTLCGMVQRIDSKFKPLTNDIRPDNVQCMKCRKALEVFILTETARSITA